MSMDGWRSFFKKVHLSLSFNLPIKDRPRENINKLSLLKLRCENVIDDSPLPAIKLHGYIESTKDRLLTSELCEEARALIPRRIQLYTDWHLLYSLEQHGASLHSLYKHVRSNDQINSRIGYLLVIKDRKGGIFGGYANEPFHQTDSRKYYGNGECFLWKVDKVSNVVFDKSPSNINYQNGRKDEPKLQFRGYRYTGINEFCIYCTNMFLSMGAGNGHYGLWCDDGLMCGVSDPSTTFGNDILSKEGNKFHIIGLEVWRVG